MKYHGYEIYKERRGIYEYYVVYTRQDDGSLVQNYMEQIGIFGSGRGSNMRHVKMMIDGHFGRL